MVNTSLLVLPAPASPQAHLLAYEELCETGSTSSRTWREMADRLLVASTQVPGPFARKFLDRSADCRARARSIDDRRTAQVTTPIAFSVVAEIARWEVVS